MTQANNRKRSDGKAITFADLQKGYDTISILTLWEILENLNIRHTLINTLKELYKNSKSGVEIVKYLTEEFPVTKGLR